MLKKTNILRCELKQRLREVIPKQIQEFKEVKAKYGDKVVSEVKVSQILGGMRGIPGLFYETSKLDANKGILLRNHNLFDLVKTLKFKDSEEPLPESLLWFLFTGEVPNEKQTENVIEDIHRRNQEIHFQDTERLLNSLPNTIHPMTQLSMAVLSLQQQSKFAHAYRSGISKSEYWAPYYDDSLNLIAVLPRIAAIIYNNVFFNKRPTPKYDFSKNYAENLAHMMGYNSKEIVNYLSHYLVLHSDHEGGNVSAHASSLVSSALSDPYLSYSAGLNGLAGPLHGLANQEVLRWLLDCNEKIGDNPTDEELEAYAKSILDSGKVIPGYGHAVLREVDPRYTIQVHFGDKYMPNDILFKLVKQCFRVIPNVLKATGKVKNPWPNVDCSSGVILHHYGIKEFDFYTVIFGVSRALGVLPTLTCARAYGLPIERPGSVTLDWIKNKFD
jgi:citrate synthase